MAIKPAELFSQNPAHAFDFAPVAPAAVYNQTLLPRYNQFVQQFGEEPVTVAAPPQRAVAPVFREEESFAALPPQRTTPVAGIPATPESTDVSTPVSDQYEDYADFMFKSEARMRGGKLQVYSPPSGDGGGAYEVAGITAKYQPEVAARLRGLIESGQHEEAAQQAREFYRQRAAPFVQHTGNRGLQLQLADTVHHRGEGGLRKILQRATGSSSRNYGELITGLSAREDALDAFHAARQDYEWEEVDRGRKSREKFRRGLQNRFNNANAAARQLL